MMKLLALLQDKALDKSVTPVCLNVTGSQESVAIRKGERGKEVLAC